jgi:SAM-dependent methyltransferase
MNATNYYDDYWNHEAHKADGWTPSEGIITPEEKLLFEKWIPRGATCLDYGCGDGSRYGRAMKERGVDYRGFDISPKALEQARTLGLNVGVLDAGGRTTLADAAVDAAICFEVLEHLQEPQLALAEIFRCLKPGSHALLSVPNAGFWTARIEFLLTGFWCPGGSPLTARKEPWRDPHIRFYNPSLLRRLVRSAGFEVAQELGERFSLGAFPVIWRRPRLCALAGRLSRPVAWLGRLMPSLFAPRIFIVARRPL